MIDKRLSLLLAIPLLIGLALSIWVSSGAGALPMDDAYILRQYAVNLANGNGWGFNRGEISFGTTSLLWPVIISGPMAIFSSLTYKSVAYIFGLISFLGLIALIEWWVWRETDNLFLPFLAGTYMAISPAGYMNAVSGMESMFFAAAMIGVLAIYRFSGMKRPVLLGLLSGMIFLIRPEGLYLALAIPGAEIIGDLRGKTVAYKKYLHFTAGFVILAAPYIIFVRLNTPGWLPTTYAGKIISSDPFMHRFGILYDFAAGLRTVFKGHWRAMGRFGLAGAVLWTAAAGWIITLAARVYRNNIPAVDIKVSRSFGVVFGCILAVALFSIYETMKIAVGVALLAALAVLLYMFIQLVRARETEGEWEDMEGDVRGLALVGLLAMPFAYGAVFRAGPLFGGYYERYILPMVPALIILSVLGLVESGKYFRFSKKKQVALIVLAVLLGYPVFRALSLIPAHREVYRTEARLNSGSRMGAAMWIKENTPSNAVIFLGYTGLGVVGGFSERKVLDMGALINPDIFPYYSDVPAAGKKRWERTLSYMADTGVDYFVTVPNVRNDPSSDPSGEPGFKKVAVVEDPGFDNIYATIEIWRIDQGVIGKGK